MLPPVASDCLAAGASVGDASDGSLCASTFVDDDPERGMTVKAATAHMASTAATIKSLTQGPLAVGSGGCVAKGCGT